uniref:Uncharacterized protein n=1 Tax=Magallana gigas TaxID=29159 RepID=A0A8W8KHV6_MAGGI
MRNILYCLTSLSIICESKEQMECTKSHPYPCCYNQQLNDDNNTCIECPNGSIGWNCKSLCPSGFYGRLCESPCECVVTECHHVTGCITTIGTSSVKPRETLRTEPTVSNFMNTMSTNAKEKHTQGKLNDYSYRIE